MVYVNSTNLYKQNPNKKNKNDPEFARHGVRESNHIYIYDMLYIELNASEFCPPVLLLSFPRWMYQYLSYKIIKQRIH